MSTEAEIRGAERARLETLVAEHGTEGEQLQLLFDGVMRAGISVEQYEGLEPLGHLPAGIELLSRLARRAERRAKFGLPTAECGGSPPTHSCACLQRALDESGAGSKRAVLKVAAGFHWAPPPRSERAEPESSPAPPAQEPNEDVPEAAAPSRPPKPPPVPEKPHRVIKRTPKWYDPETRIEDMRF